MWTLKLDENEHVVVQDGKPVFTDKDGKDIPVDVPQMYQKILDLGKEAKTNRLAADAAAAERKTALALFEGIEDLKEWKTKAEEAMAAVANFNEKDWLKADKVDSMKRQMKEAHEDEKRQLATAFEKEKSNLASAIEKQKSQIHKLVISNKFAQHPLWSGEDPKTTLKPEIAEAFFGKHFKVEEDEKTGELVERAYFGNGDLVYSRKRAGEPADFFEAMEEIFDQYPGKDSLLRAKSGGSGSTGGEGDKGKPAGILEKLRAQYTEAEKARNATAMTSIKNQIFRLEQQQAAGAKK
jgi:hypothetical protein